MLLLASIAPAGASAAVRLDPVGTFTAPVFVSSLPDDPDRVLVVEQRGTIQLVDHGVASTFLDLRTPRLVSSGGERGLLSVALAPDYPSTHHLYVFYTRSPDGALQIDEFTADGGSVAGVDPARPVLTIPHPTFLNHNGGMLAFGPDGFLYIGTGDGGGAGDPAGNAQTRDPWEDPADRPTTSGAAGYSIPPTTRSPAVAARDLGLRAAQPVAVLFDRLTGDLLIGDVGQGEREEIDYRVPSPRSGSRRELRLELPRGPDRVHRAGRRLRRPSRLRLRRPDLRLQPRWRGVARSSAATSSAIRASAISTAATCSATTATGTIRSLVPGQPFASDPRSEGLSVSGPSSFGEDSCGRIYVAALGGGGTVSRLDGDSPAPLRNRRRGRTGAAPLRWRAGDQGRRRGPYDLRGIAGRRRNRRGPPATNRIRSGAGDNTDMRARRP